MGSSHRSEPRALAAFSVAVAPLFPHHVPASGLQLSSCRPRILASRPHRKRASVSMGAELPLLNARKLSYKLICEQVAAAIVSAVNDTGARRLCVDWPPERSEQRAGTLVSRFENNLNMCEKILEELGTARGDWTQVGGDVEICDNINPQGGGEYLTDDLCMVGVRGACPRLSGKFVTVLINAGVDASTLKDVKNFDRDDEIIVLVNCAIDRMSFFDKLGFAKYIDSFQSVYYLKLFLGVGMLMKQEPHPWSAFAQRDDGAVLVEEFKEKPQIFKVEQLLRQNIG